MPYNRVHVRDFLTAAEVSLFEASIGADLKALGAADLQRRIARTRTLRAKYRDLLRRQKLKTRERTGSKTGTSGQANERTAKKATALDEALKRFEAQARGAAKTTRAQPASASRQAKPKAVLRKAKPARRTEPAVVVLRRALEKKHAAQEARVDPAAMARSVKAPAQPPIAAADPAGPTPPAVVRAAAVASRQNAANLKPIQGHISTQVRQAQAKRDQRG